MAHTDRRRVAVVGAGVAGLTAAHRLAPRHDVVVFEQSAQVGGKLRGGEVAGLRLDLGAESLLARRPEAVALLEELGLGAEIEHPATSQAGVWSRGAVHPLPTGTLMGVPGDPQVLVGLLTPEEVARVEAEPELGSSPLERDVPVGSWVAGRMGTAVVDRLVEPLLGGVYAGRAEHLSLQATVPQLWQIARHGGSLLKAVAVAPAAVAATQGAGTPVFAGVPGGVARLVEVLAERAQAQGVDLRTSTTVRDLRRTPTGWRLVTGSRAQESTTDVDAVVLALPARPASRLLSTEVPQASSDLAGIDYASVALLTLVLPREVLGAVAGSGVLVPPVEGRATKAVTFSSLKWAWVAQAAPHLAVVRMSLGRAGEERVLQRDDDELVAICVAELGELVRSPVRPIDAHVARWGGALPQYAVGHVDRVARIRRAVGRAPGLAVCGAAYDGVGVPACIASAGLAVESLRTHLEAPSPAPGG